MGFELHSGFRYGRFLGSWRMFPVVILVSISIGCSQSDYGVINGSTMGTYYSVTSRCPVAAEASAIEATLERLNAIFSTYDTRSTISTVNRSPRSEWIDVEEEFVDLVDRAAEISRQTDGAFDATVQELVEVWGFGVTEERPIPDSSTIEDLMLRVGYQNLETRRSPPVVMKRTDLKLNFSGIAKGYAVDQIAVYLKRLSCSDYLIDIGGEIRVSGLNPESRKWAIGVETADGSGEVAIVIELSDRSVASSGDYRNFRMYEGKKYSHIIDPKTGKPIGHDSVAVTVVAEDGATADALATAFLVMGHEEAMRTAQQRSIPVAFFLREKTNGLETVMNSWFRELIVQ